MDHPPRQSRIDAVRLYTAVCQVLSSILVNNSPVSRYLFDEFRVRVADFSFAKVVLMPSKNQSSKISYKSVLI